jgi:hypothetical protein
MNKSIPTDKLLPGKNRQEVIYVKTNKLSSYFVLDENVIFIPINNFCCNFEPLKNANKSSKPHVAGTKQNLAFLTFDDVVES